MAVIIATMIRQDQRKKEKNRRRALNILCSASSLLLSLVCCIALIHVELKIQEHHRLISHSVAFCDQMETEILKKVRHNYVKHCVYLWKYLDYASARMAINNRSTRAFYILIHFFAVLCKTTTWYDQIQGFVENVNAWRWIYHFLS